MGDHRSTPRKGGRPRKLLFHRRQSGQRHGDLLGRVLVVLQLARLVIDVGLHVEMAVAGEVEEDGLFPAFFFGLQRLAE